MEQCRSPDRHYPNMHTYAVFFLSHYNLCLSFILKHEVIKLCSMSVMKNVYFKKQKIQLLTVYFRSSQNHNKRNENDEDKWTP